MNKEQLSETMRNTIGADKAQAHQKDRSIVRWECAMLSQFLGGELRQSLDLTVEISFPGKNKYCFSIEGQDYYICKICGDSAVLERKGLDRVLSSKKFTNLSSFIDVLTNLSTIAPARKSSFKRKELLSVATSLTASRPMKQALADAEVLICLCDSQVAVASANQNTIALYPLEEVLTWEMDEEIVNAWVESQSLQY